MNHMADQLHEPLTGKEDDRKLQEGTNAKVKRSRQPRGSACQRCASLKMKCVAGPVRGKCERCHGTGDECVPVPLKPRKRRNADGLGMQVERPILTSLVKETARNNDQQQTPLLSRSDLRQRSAKSYASLLAESLAVVDNVSGLLDGVDSSFVVSSITVFRDRQSSVPFPFVCIQAGTDAIDLSLKRPMLTLAICIATSSAQATLQSRLIKVFRTALGSKVILEGERSVDLMLGLLIFLSWHHQYMAKQQIYQELCLLAGMAADLGLYRSSSKLDMQELATGERERAFVGCYYLCTTLSILGFNKPNPFQWTENLRRCADKVSDRSPNREDRLLVPLVELAHALDELESVWALDFDAGKDAPSHSSRLYGKLAMSRMRTLHRNHAELSSIMAYPVCNIHFHYRLVTSSDTQDSSCIVRCAYAVGDFLDDMLARPAIVLYQLNIVDWANLLGTLVLMLRLSRASSQSASWEAGAVASMLQPEAKLDAFVHHMASVPVGNPLVPRHERLLEWLKRFCGGIKQHILPTLCVNNADALSSTESYYDAVYALGKINDDKELPNSWNDGLSSQNNAATTTSTAGFNFDDFGIFGIELFDDGFSNDILNSI